MADKMNSGLPLWWTQSARRHRIGKVSARHVIATVEPTRTSTLGGADAWIWIGLDERGRELEIIAIDVNPPNDQPYRLVIHVMPTQLRRR